MLACVSVCVFAVPKQIMYEVSSYCKNARKSVIERKYSDTHTQVPFCPLAHLTYALPNAFRIEHCFAHHKRHEVHSDLCLQKDGFLFKTL